MGQPHYEETESDQRKLQVALANVIFESHLKGLKKTRLAEIA
jgi:hypothetical protein